ncbi:hypothetical protein GCM10010275_71270 [Streptomyces litmocidini]|uniref:DUF427 domain-containing protein n=1 Tax=Streptomyces litmocidini TaxID=67318 RepID=UPI00167E711F|nr:DUF427 domain-containing protein [Streptomyces litmocidini]GGV19348.1 hypothetical protein GCM10010275_71270 [Streptomyces litmocidini]
MDRMPVASGEESVWDYPRPPRAEADHRHLTVRVGSILLAETHNGLRLLETSHPPVFYFPRADVHMELLRQTQDRTVCEWKGTATYWDALVAGAVIPRAGWSYESPRAGYASIAGYLAFHPSKTVCAVDGEVVVAQDGDFYGGWITHEIRGPFKGGPGTWSW